MSYPHQDWKTVVLRKDKPIVKTPVINTVKKNTSSATSVTTKKVYDVDGEMEIVPVMIEKKFGDMIQKARMDRKMTQKELANALSIPLSVINEYERGQGVRTGLYVSKIKKYLGIDKNT